MNNRTKTSYDIGTAISPLDGRNRHKLTKLSENFSDFVLTKNRIKIEIDYLIKLSEYKIIRKISNEEKITMYQYIERIEYKDYDRVRTIEKKTNHEAKAAEEFVKEDLRKTSLEDVSEMVHFGLTSDDINNLSYGLMMKDCLNKVIVPEISKAKDKLRELAIIYKNLPMLSRTHGQPAVPTTLGKELLVYFKRLDDELKILGRLKFRGKLTGNTGNLNAHKLIFPKVDWLKFSVEFVKSLGLEPDLATTQIQPYDSLIRIFQSILNINNILTGLSVDMWLYISIGYFKQKLVKSEVGSTALPHKINPIYFEGAEGGFGIANALLEFYVRKLSYSRLQRDLSDSTVRRSFGIALAYSLLSYQSINEGLRRIESDPIATKFDLDTHTEVLSEAIQNYLRSKNHHDAYDKTKEFFRGKKTDISKIRKFITGLEISNSDKKILSELTPEKYTGYAEEIVELNIKD